MLRFRTPPIKDFTVLWKFTQVSSSSRAQSREGGRAVASAGMKYSYQYPVSQYTRSNTQTHYTNTHYTPSHYNSGSYSPSLYGSTKYSPSTLHTASYYTPPAYTPANKSTYTPLYSKSSRQTSSPRTSVKSTPTVTVKPARAVRFTNDVIFQDLIRHGELEQIGRFLRARKVRLDTIFHSGMAALHEAVLSGDLECVKLLIKYGADVHQRDENGWTPLHMACSDGFPEIAKYLLSLGASVEAENENGEKPADLIDPDCKELVKLFETGCV